MNRATAGTSSLHVTFQLPPTTSSNATTTTTTTTTTRSSYHSPINLPPTSQTPNITRTPTITPNIVRPTTTSITTTTSTAMMNQNSSQSNLNLSQNNYNFMSRPQQPLELVPAGQSYTQLTYEPNHKCTVCGHVHSCQDCQRAMLFQQALEPQETKYMDPFILNTAKKMARKYRRTEVDPYSRIKVSRNVGISQDEILERTFKNPTLSITDIVNQINKENEEAREKALMEESDYYNMKTDNSNLFISPITTPGNIPSTIPTTTTTTTITSGPSGRINNIYITTPATPITPIIPNPPSTIYTPPISSPHFRNISTFGLGNISQPTAVDGGGVFSNISQPSTVVSGGGGGSTTAGGGIVEATTPIFTSTTGAGTSSSSSSSFRLTDPTLGYKKAIIKYAAPRQPAAVKKQLPNPVTPNLKMVSGSTLSEMGIFFKRLWGWY